MTAQIYDRGYRRYDGERTGTFGILRSLWVASVQRALGLRRKFRFKIVPLLTVLLAYVPATAFLGIAILLPDDLASEVTADYAGYYGLITVAVFLFAAFVAPELLSSDRSSGLLGMYLAAPVTRNLYLLAKGVALVSLMLLVTMLPVVFLLVGYSLVGIGPEGIVETARVVGRITLGGLVMAVYFTLLGMAGATLSVRKGFATAGIIISLLVSTVLVETLVEEAGAPDWVRLLSLGAVPFDVNARLFDEPIEQLPGISHGASVGAYAGLLALFAATVYWGYRRMVITK